MPRLLLAGAGLAVAAAVSTLAWPAVGLASVSETPRNQAARPGSISGAVSGALEPGSQAEAPDPGERTRGSAEADHHAESSALGIPVSVLERLSSEQVGQLLLQHEKARDHLDGDVLIAVALFASIVLIVLILQLAHARRARELNRTLRLMVERGVEIPVELVAKRQRASSDLRRGLILSGGGVGLALFFALLDTGGTASGLWSIGFVPLLIGGGYLLMWRHLSKSAGGG